MAHLSPLPLTVLSGITVLEKELPQNELSVPVLEILFHLKGVIKPDSTFTFKYDFPVISFHNDSLKFNEYGDSAHFKDQYNNVYIFDFIDNGMDYLLHSLKLSTDEFPSEEIINRTLHQLGLNSNLLGRPTLEIVLYCRVMQNQGIIVDIHPNINSTENLKTFQDVKKILMCRTFREMLNETYGDANQVSFSFGELDFIFYCYIDLIRPKLWVE